MLIYTDILTEENSFLMPCFHTVLFCVFLFNKRSTATQENEFLQLFKHHHKHAGETDSFSPFSNYVNEKKKNTPLTI